MREDAADGRDPYRVYDVDDFLGETLRTEGRPESLREPGQSSDRPAAASPATLGGHRRAGRGRRHLALFAAVAAAVLVMTLEVRSRVAPVEGPGPAPATAPAGGEPSTSTRREHLRESPRARRPARRRPTGPRRRPVAPSAVPAPSSRPGTVVVSPVREFGFER